MSLLDTASLIVTPNGYKEGKLYSVIPSDGSGDMSVVRATTATRVNSAGLVELVPYNLLGYSEQLDNATSWGFGDVVLSSNQTIAPNGTTTADKVTINTVNNEHVVYNATNYVNEVGQWTTSVYLKKGNSDYVQLSNNGTTAANFAYIVVNLNNGVVTQSAGSGSYTLNSYAVTSVGDGWYRCSITYTNTSDEVRGIRIRFSNSATPIVSDYGTIVFTGNGTDFFYAWGAQFNSGSLKDYQKTETRLNIPRLDYSNGTCPSLLVEPQRTNLALQSSSFDNADWNNSGLTITANQTISPSGVQDADLFDDGTASNTVHWMWQGQSLANSTTYTISFYAKYISRKNLVVNIYNGSTSQFVNYDIQNGAIFGSTGDVTATIESVGNGWYRCTYTRTMASSGSPNYRIGLSDDSGNQTYTGSNKQAYIWGAQLEAGSYSTSYIPTTSASVTRNADVISKTGISSLIGQTEGTLFAEIYADQAGSANNWFEIYDGTSNNWIFLGKEGIKMRGYIRASGTTYFDNTTFTITDNAPMKVALAYKSGDYAFYINGTLIFSSSSSFTINNSISIVNFGFGLGTVGDSSAYKAAALWKTRLTNAQLATLTTI